MAKQEKLLNRDDLNLLLKLIKTPGKSTQEGAIVSLVQDELKKAGVPKSAMTTDKAHEKSEHGGEVGNLIVKLPGKGKLKKSPRRMLSCHVDTVPLAEGCEPKVVGTRVVSKSSETALGADNRAGTAAVLMAARDVLVSKDDYPPLTLVFFVQEENGLRGSNYADYSKIGKPKFGFNFDGGSCAKITHGATGAYRMKIDVTGIASHAGVRPENGVSAITIAGLAIAKLQKGRWLGKVDMYQAGGTSNIGYIHAGGATNVVTNHLELKAEVRSHVKRFRNKMRDRFVQAFKEAAQQVQNVAGETGQVEFDIHLDYESFKLSKNAPIIRFARQAVHAVGDEPVLSVTDGGLDANNTTANGIPTVTFGVGQENPHTVDEALNLYEFSRAKRMALHLARGDSLEEEGSNPWKEKFYAKHGKPEKYK